MRIVSTFWAAILLGLLFQSAVPATGLAQDGAKPVGNATMSATTSLTESKPKQVGGIGRKSADKIDGTTHVEMQRRFIELRRELLDDRARTLDWWLAGVAVFLTLLAVVATVAGFVSFNRFREIERQASKHLKTAEDHAATVKRHAEAAEREFDHIHERKLEFEKILNRVTAESVGKDPAKAAEAARGVGEDPEATVLNRAVAGAILDQQNDDRKSAIEKWKAIAVISEGIDNELGARAWFSVGYLHSQLNEFIEALDAYDRSISLRQGNPATFNNRGATKAELGRNEDAIADYDEAIRLKPDYHEAFYNRGNAKAELGRNEDAIADYDEAIRLNPDFHQAFNNRGNAKAELGRNEDAIADYDEAIRLKPDYHEAFNNRGNAKAELGRNEDAIVDYDEAIRLKPDYHEAFYNRGNAKAELGRNEDAIADYDEAIRLKPDGHEAFSNRGNAKAKLGRNEDATADFDEAARLKPDDC